MGLVKFLTALGQRAIVFAEDACRLLRTLVDKVGTVLIGVFLLLDKSFKIGFAGNFLVAVLL